MKKMLNAHPHLKLYGAGLTALLFLYAPVFPLFAATDSETLKTSSPQSNGEDLSYPKLVIGPGDLLVIQVYGENGSLTTSSINANNQLPTTYQVDSDGIIVFPFLGRVKLKGLTAAQASEKIAGLLSKPRKVTVLIQVSNTFWVSIMGNVAKPDRYQIVGQPTLLSALAEAGGPLPGTDMGGAILVHDNFKKKIDLSKFLQGEGPTQPDPYLYPGDLLMVQKSPWPDLGTLAVIASILGSGALAAVEISSLRH